MHVSATLGESFSLAWSLPMFRDSSPWPHDPSLCWVSASHARPLVTFLLRGLGVMAGRVAGCVEGAAGFASWADVMLTVETAIARDANATARRGVFMMAPFRVC